MPNRFTHWAERAESRAREYESIAKEFESRGAEEMAAYWHQSARVEQSTAKFWRDAAEGKAVVR